MYLVERVAIAATVEVRLAVCQAEKTAREVGMAAELKVAAAVEVVSVAAKREAWMEEGVRVGVTLGAAILVVKRAAAVRAMAVVNSVD